MKVLFYSEKCKFSKEIIKQIEESKFSMEFKFVNIDSNEAPEMIKVVPTIIDTNYKDLLEGKRAFEYLFNKKYFNISTNNIHLWKDKVLPKPEIKENMLAKNNDDILNETIENNEEKLVEKEKEKPKAPEKKKILLSKKNLLLIRGRN